MKRPNEAQVTTAVAIIAHHNRTYGMAGAEGSARRLVYSVLAAMGGIGQVSAEYDQVVADNEVTMKGNEAFEGETDLAVTPEWFTVTIDEDTTTAMIEVTADNAFGIEIGSTFSDATEDAAPVADWYSIETNTNTGATHMHVTGDNSYGLEVGLTLVGGADVSDPEIDDGEGIDFVKPLYDGGELTEAKFDELTRADLVDLYGEDYDLTSSMTKSIMKTKLFVVDAESKAD
jgi:hypothetical protein